MQRYFCSNKIEDRFILSKESSHHIVNVMRMKIGDFIEVVSEEKVYKCKIITLPMVEALIIEEIKAYNEMNLKVTICQTLVKENKIDTILMHGVELGMHEFIPLKTKNSIIRLDLKEALKKRLRWEKIVLDAARQSKRNIVPKVSDVMEIKDIIKKDYDLKILCTVNELSTTFKNVLQNNKNCGTMIIVIGPEGGFTHEEEKLLITNGFISTTLGKLVLRTETASLCALSMINYEYER